jgi:type I restriction enzyme, S subunit
LLAHKLGAGSTPLGGKTVYQAEGVAFVRSQNVYNDGLRLADVARISRATHERMSGTHVQAHDILLNITGASIGRCAIVPDDFVEGNVSQHVAIIRLVLKDIRAFVHLSLISPLFQELIEDVQVGVSREGRSMQRLRQFPILLPPLPEQHRIVARVEDLAAVCDRLEAAQAERDRRRDRVVAAALRRLNQGRTADYPTGKICRLDDLLPLRLDAITSNIYVWPFCTKQSPETSPLMIHLTSRPRNCSNESELKRERSSKSSGTHLALSDCQFPEDGRPPPLATC